MKTSQQIPLLALCQGWTEYERGWGSRSDGSSLHLTESDHKVFCAEYWARMPNGYVPDEYSVETGKPYLAVVDTVLYGRLKHGAGKGLWVSPGEMRSGLVRKASPDEILLVHS